MISGSHSLDEIDGVPTKREKRPDIAEPESGPIEIPEYMRELRAARKAAHESYERVSQVSVEFARCMRNCPKRARKRFGTVPA